MTASTRSLRRKCLFARLQSPLVAALLVAAPLVAACDEASPPSPEATLAEFVELMERGRTEVGALRGAYSLLEEAAQAQLRARAMQASTLARREFEPWQMFAQGRSRLRVTPDSMSSRIDGNEAIVVVRGGRDGGRVEVPMVRQGGRWRVRLAIPSAAPPSAVPSEPPVQPSPGAAEPGQMQESGSEGR